MTARYAVTFEFETKAPLTLRGEASASGNAHIGGTGGENSHAGGRPTDVVVSRRGDRACKTVNRDRRRRQAYEPISSTSRRGLMTVTESCELVIDLTRELSVGRGDAAVWRLIGLTAIHHAHDLHVENERLRRQLVALRDELRRDTERNGSILATATQGVFVTVRSGKGAVKQWRTTATW